MENVPYYFSAFKPFGYQRSVLDLFYNYDYKNNFFPEMLLSGSVGSAKSSLGAHMIISHCLRWRKARAAISRMGLPDLKKTIFQEIIDSLENDPNFIEGVHYKASYNSAHIKFANGSEIMPLTFGDKNWGKSKSYLFSFVLIEEGTEYHNDFYNLTQSGFALLKGRINRLSHVRENALVVLTNPDDPTHFLYDYFIEGSKIYDNRYVFYSETAKNPYLDPNYIKQLRQDYSFLMAERYLRGRWISLWGKGIYHAYNEKNQVEGEYKVSMNRAIHVCFDFNVAEGKPMSACVFQYNARHGHYHVFAESIVDNAGWCLDCLEDLETKGVLRRNQEIIIHGDATGSAKSSNSLKSNYDLIKEWLTHRRYSFSIKVPKSNPPISTRHTTVNALLLNDLKQVKCFIYDSCPVLRTGLKSTKFKPGTRIEDDSLRSQHVTTSLGYGLYFHKKISKKPKKAITRK